MTICDKSLLTVPISDQFRRVGRCFLPHPEVIISQAKVGHTLVYNEASGTFTWKSGDNK